MLGVPIILVIMMKIREAPEGLHQALSCAIIEDLGDGSLFTDLFPELHEFLPVLRRVLHVRVIDERGEIVFLTPQAKALEIDEEGFFAGKEDVL